MDKENVLKVCNQIADRGLLKTLGIKFTDVGNDFLTASMPVNEKVYQPDGILHGGATVALAETVGSAAVAVLTKNSNLTIRGIEINANHIKSVKNGNVIATAKPIHLGKTIQLWEIRTTDQENQLISISKLTTYTREKK
ncbi:MAG: hotdog fold thioesterase [Flavobacteriaceae bacterium]|jgi:1,4-dihydroxy-2-naphthoyl-CoA hydrolase|nr:hotdog fold thioesterase [Flavobacteriaceae bacterium]|tara:strand:+ start:61 stop:477 length:417 start_codon:yes stop_codon:yes gene_type:complete